MSSFLQRLKSGATAVNNNAPPDSAGVVTRKLEKKTLTQPFEQLGITFGVDAEVASVAPRSPAAAANIPTGFMVFDVNGEFVENEQQFVEAARKTINLTIKLQSTTGISELIARVLRDEEMRSNGEISGSSIDFDELYRTTPRFNFLSGDHPLFRRYNKRLTQARQAAALIAQRTREAELQRQREIKERMKRALEEEEAAQRKKEAQEEAERARKNASQPPEQFLSDEPFIRIIKDESAFGQLNQDAKPGNETPAAAPTNESQQAVPIEEAPLPQLVETAAPSPPLAPAPAEVAPVTADELLALVGLPTDSAPPPTPSPINTANLTPLPESEGSVSYVALPAEEYTLCSGEKVVSVIKRRTGPVPPPPPGKPPTVNNTASQAKTPLNQAPSKQTVQPRRDSAPSGRKGGDRKRSRSPSSRRRSRPERSSRNGESRERTHRHSSSSHREHRSSPTSRHRR